MRDYDARTAAHMLNGSLRKFLKFSSQHQGGGLVEMAELPEVPQSVVRVSERSLGSRGEEMVDRCLDATNEPLEPI